MQKNNSSTIPIVKLQDLLIEFTQKNKNNEKIPVYSVTNEFGFTTEYFSKDVFSKNLKTYKIVERGDFAYNPSRINVGSIDYFKHPGTGLISPLYVTFKTKDTLDIEYLKYYLKSSTGNQQIRNNTSGSVRDTLSFKQLSRITIPLPDVQDQKAIVGKIKKAEALQQKRKQTIKLLDDYIKSIFVELFGDPIDNPKKFTIKKLGEVVEKVTDGTHKTPHYAEEGIKFISAKNIKDEKIDWEDIKYITEQEHREIYKRCNVKKDDLLLTKSGSLGMAAVVDVEFEFSLFESLALIKLNDSLVKPIYAREYLNSKSVKNLYKQKSKGIGVKHLHLIDIKSLPIIVPPIELQNNFIDIVNKSISIKQKMQLQLSEFLMQYQALMQKSFQTA